MKRFATMTVLTLLVLTGTSSADDPEPPGRGLDTRKLTGKWLGVRVVLRGVEQKAALGYSYTFDRNRYTYESGGRAIYGGTVEVNSKKKPTVLELTRDNTTTAYSFAAKIEKGELFLVPEANGVASDFTGKTLPVMILSREKR